MNWIDSIRGVREYVSGERAAGRTVALVPTMGFLHEGHLSLVDRARERADSVVLSIFVNPLQFGPREDFESYPRDPERDRELARGRGVDAIFAPSSEAMYPGGGAGVRIAPGPMADRMCGAFRPGHFEGVLTVVAKLFNIVQPDLAVFGRKDYQQAVLIRAMVDELAFPVRIELGPIIREPDGLALSSRNRYLNDDARERALRLFGGLSAAAEAFRAGERSASALRDIVRDTIEAGSGVRVQYVELVDPDTLESREEAASSAVLAVAAFVDQTRLIDNIVLG